jgi:hypothetical protein
MKDSMKLIKLPILMLVLTVFFACANEPDEEETPPDDSIFRPEAVRLVSFSGETSVVTLENLKSNSIYLVKANKGGETVSAANTGKVLNIGAPQDVLAKNALNAAGVIQEQVLFTGGGGDEPISGIFTGPNGETIIRYEHHPNNEKIFDAINAGNLNARSVSRGMGAEYSNILTSYTIDISTKKFWTQDESEKVFSQISTTLRAAGTYSNVWVANVNYDSSSSQNDDNKITTAQAQALAQKFDTIYQKETPVFGFEYGGGLFNGTNYNGNGGVDGDPKIQILVYDIFDDYKADQTGGVFGYFWAGDEFETGNPVLEDGKSNEAEIFYIDAHFTDLVPDAMYSTLAHEFQHMINFNVKYISSSSPKSTDIWYNEMLSMIAEDLIDPFIGISADNDSHPIKSRIPIFLSCYYIDPTVWLSGTYVYISYSNAYALGAYLVRNFGGVDFVKAVMSNSEVDIASLNLALANSGVNPLSAKIKNLNAALRRYGEALLFNQSSGSRPADVLSFNNTVSSDGYTFTGFDLLSLENANHTKGPVVWDAAESYPLEPHTVLLLSRSVWQNVTGERTITLQRPADSNIEFYIIVR